MSRNKGTYNYSANLEVKKRGPLDAKQLVGTRSDLTGTTTWTDSGYEYTYVGMIVSVSGDTTPSYNGVYHLIASGYTDINNWELVGNDGVSVTSISSALSSEISVRTSADLSLSSIISSEISVRTSADLSLSSIISSDISTRGSADTSLSSAISSGDLSLSSALSSETSTRGSSVTSLSSAISSEISVRDSVDTSLSTALSSAISSEISTRSSADTSLSSAISSEISTRNSDDISLSSAISSEISTRSSADTSLSTAVSTTNSSIVSVSSALSSEISTRDSVDTSLSSAISTETSSRTNVENTFLKLTGGTLTDGLSGTTIYLNDNIISANTRKISANLLSVHPIIWDMNISCTARVTLTASTSLTINNVVSGDTGTIVVIQGSGGNFTLGLPSGSLYAGGSITLSTVQGSRDILSFFYYDSCYYWNIGKNYY